MSVSIKSHLLNIIQIDQYHHNGNTDDVENLYLVTIYLTAPYNASISRDVDLNDIHGGKQFYFTMNRTENETGHAFRIRVINAMDAISAAHMLGKIEQQKEIRQVLGISD